jgi:hypothetical protein
MDILIMTEKGKWKTMLSSSPSEDVELKITA